MYLMDELILPGGAIMLATFASDNYSQYDEMVRIYANIHGYKIEKTIGSTHHKMRKL
jgi:hypothetical protein